MSYDVHICNTNFFWQSATLPIPIEYWNEIVKNDNEFDKEDISSKIEEVGLSIVVNSNQVAIWNNPKVNGCFNKVYFSYKDGRITVENPDEATIIKLKELSLKLNARVIGDEGEEY